jgi:hypothetical protein
MMSNCGLQRKEGDGCNPFAGATAESYGSGSSSASKPPRVAASGRPLPRKRKSKVTGPGTQTPDLNIPLQISNAIVPVGLVNSCVNQLDVSAESSGGSMIETLKKQKRGVVTTHGFVES